MSAGARKARLTPAKLGLAPRRGCPVSPKGTCPTGKVRWGSAEVARTALAHAALRPSGRRHEARVYACDECGGGWHLTSRPRWVSGGGQ